MYRKSAAKEIDLRNGGSVENCWYQVLHWPYGERRVGDGVHLLSFQNVSNKFSNWNLCVRAGELCATVTMLSINEKKLYGVCEWPESEWREDHRSSLSNGDIQTIASYNWFMCIGLSVCVPMCAPPTTYTRRLSCSMCNIAVQLIRFVSFTPVYYSSGTSFQCNLLLLLRFFPFLFY